MPDYKEMYLKMVRATEAAMDCLIAAQRECEEMYIQAEAEKVLPFDPPPRAKRPKTAPETIANRPDPADGAQV